MRPNAHYFATFLAEMQSYLAEMRQQVRVLASPTRAYHDPAESARALRRVGHTIAGLAATFELTDFALIGQSVERVFARLVSGDAPLPRAIGSHLSVATIFLELRVGAMEREQRFVPPDAGDLTEARRVATSLESFAAAAEPPVEAAPLAGLVDDPELAAELAVLPADLQATLAAFLRADLALEENTPEPPPGLTDAVSDFALELADDLVTLRERLVAAQHTDAPQADLQRMREVAHKIKGAAFMVGAQGIGGIADMGESLLTALSQHQIALNAAAVRWLIAAIETLDTLRQRVRASGDDEGATAEQAALHEGYAAIMAAADAPTAPRLPPARISARPAPADRALARIDLRRIDGLMASIGAMMIDRHAAQPLFHSAGTGVEDLERAADRLAELSDRLRAERLATGARPDASGTAMADTVPNLRAVTLPPALASWVEKRQARAPGGTRDALELERYTEFDVLMAMVDEAILDLRGAHLALQSSLNRLRRGEERQAGLFSALRRDLVTVSLAPLADIVPRLSLAAQSAALQESKTVLFDAEVAGCELDRDSCDALIEPLVQLVRNAVAHGLESEDERAAVGKTGPARITLRATYAGDLVVITVSDDGRGINPQQVVAAALASAPISGVDLTSEQARRLSDSEALALMFLPGVSTAVEIRPTAGRGLGLASVRRAVESAGGTITVASAQGQGTTFTLRVPVSLRLVRARVVRASGFAYAVPVTAIARTLTRADLAHGAEPVEHYSLRDLVGIGATSHLPPSLLVVPAGAAEIGVWVDELSEERDLVVRPVAGYLRARGVRGAAIAPEGETLLVLDLPVVARAVNALRQSGAPAPVSQPVAGAARPDVLVVDDSPSIRHTLVDTLEGAGFAVRVARDGLEALDALREATPGVVVLDVEMPRLNGYELLDVMRAQPRWRQVPVVMLTSRAAERYREFAARLGVVDYLVKPCPADQLVAAVARYCARG